MVRHQATDLMVTTLFIIKLYEQTMNIDLVGFVPFCRCFYRNRDKSTTARLDFRNIFNSIVTCLIFIEV